jgi:hypothetical protein
MQAVQKDIPKIRALETMVCGKVAHSSSPIVICSVTLIHKTAFSNICKT